MDWVPAIVDTSAPSGARTYDYLLGGSHNFAADRAMADQVERAVPGIRAAARLNRAFLARAVRFMIGQGVRQFLDIGSGIPTVGNVHEIAHQVDPSCRVVYVDRDPIAVAHSELMLADAEHAAVVEADMRDPSSVVDDPVTRRLLDFDEPVGLLFLLVLHWVADEDDPAALVARYREVLAPGSCLAITHMTDDMQAHKIDAVAGIVRENRGAGQVFPRARAEIATLFGDLELLQPGLVPTGTWRPGGVGDIADDPEMNELSFAGVARK
ncbi:SAM-dependent methyltransferase [Actinophytocola oryzae]|uniref:S-adenosyl methyltransferase n=1 Tax=Actinophytocola oryzae TaxID=502181 RepID=A0A4R7VRS0_9PSEU|nr:SAM-dependent methyltransferase [Actinophytocola oryzae]TDV52059.1 S-adenosyl methyltransferase [Actinophytocola oryzae]